MTEEFTVDDVDQEYLALYHSHFRPFGRITPGGRKRAKEHLEMMRSGREGISHVFLKKKVYERWLAAAAERRRDAAS
jgi:hypothetical protein